MKIHKFLSWPVVWSGIYTVLCRIHVFWPLKWMLVIWSIQIIENRLLFLWDTFGVNLKPVSLEEFKLQGFFIIYRPACKMQTAQLFNLKLCKYPSFNSMQLRPEKLSFSDVSDDFSRLFSHVIKSRIFKILI